MFFGKGKFFVSGLAIFFASVAISGVASAQQANAQQPPPGWYKLCSKQADNDFCNVQFQVLSNTTGMLLTSINLVSVEGKDNRKMLQIAVPTRRNIFSGISLKIDDKQISTLPYALCFEDRCMAEIPLEDKLVRAFKSGGNLIVTSVNFQNKPNPIEITLSGFTAAYDGPSLNNDELQIRNQKLQSELQEKAKKLRKKLQAEQEKAKNKN